LAHAELGSDETDALLAVVADRRVYQRGETIVSAKKRSAHLHLLSSGWASRSKVLEDGSRQITDLNIPGDFCDLSVLSGGLTDRVVALTDATAIRLNRAMLIRAMAAYPNIANAILSVALDEQAILRAWLLCLGQQDRIEHLAHLFCELHVRLRRVGLVGDHSFDLPLTQEDLADTLGMTAVHTNRVLQRMRKAGLVVLSSRHMTILEPAKLRELAEFDRSYLAP
jgi:CRP-like cAMP-binding protein